MHIMSLVSVPWVFNLDVFSHAAARPRDLHLRLAGCTLIHMPLLRLQRTSTNRGKYLVVLAREAVVLFQILLFLIGKLKGLGVCLQGGVTCISKVVEETSQVQLHVVDLLGCVHRCFRVHFPRVCFQPVQSLLFVALVAH